MRVRNDTLRFIKICLGLLSITLSGLALGCWILEENFEAAVVCLLFAIWAAQGAV